MSRNLTEEQVAAIAVFLSGERLATFTAFAGSTRDAIELHQRVLHLGCSLMGITAVIEIALRNAVCDRLSEDFNTPGWLLHPPAHFSWQESEKQKIGVALRSAQKAQYAKKTQAEKRALDGLAYPRGVPVTTGHDDRAMARQRILPVATGQVVAQLTLFFWKRLFSADYEHALWRRALKRVFPNKTVTRAMIAEALERIYQCRNRIAHHEPIYGRRLIDTLSAIDFVLAHFGRPDDTGVTALARLLEPDIVAVRAEAEALEAVLDTFRAIPPA